MFQHKQCLLPDPCNVEKVNDQLDPMQRLTAGRSYRIIVNIFVGTSFWFVRVQSALLRKATLRNRFIQESLSLSRISRSSNDDGMLDVGNIATSWIECEVLLA